MSELKAASLRKWIAQQRRNIKETPDQDLPESQGFVAGALLVLHLLEQDHEQGRVRAP